MYHSRSYIPSNYFDGENVSYAQSPCTSSPASSIHYYHDPMVGYYHFGPGHPMKPYRLTLTHDLILHYGLASRMKVFQGRKADPSELTKFHSTDYIEFLKRTMTEKSRADLYAIAGQYNIGDDCPLFPGLFDFCLATTGCSLAAARSLVSGAASIAINWSGGLHHAKKSEASGFCYTNDINLAILELLRVFPRVLYIDIDVHHGDGVQEAFYTTDRVYTLSLHKYGDGFFPGTGSAEELGAGRGRLTSLNLPLRDGIDDAGYTFLFRPILREIVACYAPNVIVFQCGADSLGTDRLGCFNLSLAGHGACLAYAKSFGLPLLALGGGGYTIRNVSRCWTYETSLLTDTPLPSSLPTTTPHLEYFAPDYSLFPPLSALSRVENGNSRAYLEELLQNALEQIRALRGAPSVQLQLVPGDKDGMAESKGESLSESDSETAFDRKNDASDCE